MCTCCVYTVNGTTYIVWYESRRQYSAHRYIVSAFSMEMEKWFRKSKYMRWAMYEKRNIYTNQMGKKTSEKKYREHDTYNGSHFAEHRSHLNREIMEFTKRNIYKYMNVHIIYCACRECILLQNVAYDYMTIPYITVFIKASLQH